MLNPRFSKATVSNDIIERRRDLEADYEFRTGRMIDRRNGSAQVPEGDTEAAFLYGQWALLGQLFNAWDLKVQDDK